MKRTSPNIEISYYLTLLEKSGQNKVLAYIKTLFKKQPRKKDNKELLNFAGAFSSEDISEINKAIKEGCEKKDLNEW
jgi:predicted CopG family antitoxin